MSIRKSKHIHFLSLALLGSLLALPALAQNGYELPEAPPNYQPPQSGSTQQTYQKIVLPIGYRLALPSHFRQVNNGSDGQGTWRFQGNTMQVVITAWKSNQWSAKQIAYQTYQNLTSISNKSLSTDREATSFYGKRSNAYWHYVQGKGIFNNGVRAFGVAGFFNPSTNVCVSIRFDWPVQNNTNDKVYADTANAIMASVEVWH